jgi:hypothetical protein
LRYAASKVFQNQRIEALYRQLSPMGARTVFFARAGKIDKESGEARHLLPID